MKSTNALTDPLADLEGEFHKNLAAVTAPARPPRKQLPDAEEAHESNGFAYADEPPPVKGPEDFELPADNSSSAEFYTPVTVELPALLPLTIGEWLARDLPQPDCLMGHWLTTTSRVLLVGATGLGKSLLLIRLGLSSATGQDFLHWQGRRPCRVLYIDGEMSRRLLKQRLADEADRAGCMPETFFALSHEDIEGFAPLNTPAGQACIERVIERIGGVDLLLFDNVMCLVAGDMKDEEPWQQTMPWVRSLTRRSIGQIWGHHTGHDETRSYGTKTREWQMDTVALLETAQRDDTDVSFSLEFKKARERTPNTRADFQPVRIALVDDHWISDAAEAKAPGNVSPLGLKFLDALLNVLAGDNTALTNSGRKAAATDDWKAECIVLGLIDPKSKPDSARTLFNKHRRELVGANRIACEGDLSWTL